MAGALPFGESGRVVRELVTHDCVEPEHDGEAALNRGFNGARGADTRAEAPAPARAALHEALDLRVNRVEEIRRMLVHPFIQVRSRPTLDLTGGQSPLNESLGLVSQPPTHNFAHPRRLLIEAEFSVELHCIIRDKVNMLPFKTSLQHFHHPSRNPAPTVR